VSPLSVTGSTSLGGAGWPVSDTISLSVEVVGSDREGRSGTSISGTVEPLGSPASRRLPATPDTPVARCGLGSRGSVIWL
jgi:hypothetical protein